MPSPHLPPIPHRLRGAIHRAVPVLLATVAGAALIALSGRAQQAPPSPRPTPAFVNARPSDRDLLDRAVAAVAPEEVDRMTVLTADGRALSPDAAVAASWKKFIRSEGNVYQADDGEIFVAPSAPPEPRSNGGIKKMCPIPPDGTAPSCDCTPVCDCDASCQCQAAHTGGGTGSTAGSTGSTDGGTTASTAGSGSSNGSTTSGTGTNTTGTTASTGNPTTGDPPPPTTATASGGGPPSPTTTDTGGGNTTVGGDTGGGGTTTEEDYGDEDEDETCDACQLGSPATVNENVFAGTGPYRRVRTRADQNIVGVRSQVRLPALLPNVPEESQPIAPFGLFGIPATSPTLSFPGARPFVYFAGRDLNRANGVAFDIGFQGGYSVTGPSNGVYNLNESTTVWKPFVFPGTGVGWVNNSNNAQYRRPITLTMRLEVVTNNSNRRDLVVWHAEPVSPIPGEVVVVETQPSFTGGWRDGEADFSYCTSI